MPSFLGEPFEHDIFISYAHGRTGRYKTWTNRLIDELRHDIFDCDPDFDDLSIFIDTELDPAQPLTEQLRNTVKASGLLVIIMTRRYLRSSWCTDELTWFEREIRESSRQGGLILIVRAQPTDHEEWPAILKDERGETHLGFRFHAKPSHEDEHVHPYGYPEPQPEDKEFFRQLARLTTDITTRLRDIRQNSRLVHAGQPRLARPADDGVFRVLLHPPKFALSRIPEMKSRFEAAMEAWNEAKRALENVACDVWPKEVVPEGVRLSDLNRLRAERLDFLRERGHAACMLRLEEDPLVEKVEALASDRSTLLDDGLDIPLAMIDRNDAATVADDIDEVEFFHASQPGWALKFRQWLEAIHAGAAPA